MKKKIIVASTTWRNIPGNLVVEAEDIDPADWSKQTSKIGQPLRYQPKTIAEYRQLFGGWSGQLSHPAGPGAAPHPFTFDLSPWSNVDPHRYLRLDFSFEAVPPIAPTDPRYPPRPPKRSKD